MNDNILFIDNSDFQSIPAGGTLTFAQNMIKAFGNRLILVGKSRDQSKIGKWTNKIIDGHSFDFFAYERSPQSADHLPFLPMKITGYVALRRFMVSIRACQVRNVFTQIPEAALAISKHEWNSVCFRFTGVSNQVAVSKYPWARPFGYLYERMLFASLKNANCILATADDKAIKQLGDRSRGLLDLTKVIRFPTRVDMDTFKPEPKRDARKRLGLDASLRIILYCGRITWPKGWDLILDAFSIGLAKDPALMLIFIGDGEDRGKLLHRVAKENLGSRVMSVGNQSKENIVRYLNACDLFVVGSHIEGWSNAMIEALATGKPIVSTNISGSQDLIEEGTNGYVVQSRNPEEFAIAISKGLSLTDSEATSLSIARRYSVETLREDLSHIWFGS